MRMRTRMLVLFSLFMSMFMISPALAGDWCYQESANVSTVCGGFDTGVYSYSGAGWNCGGENNPYCIYDENWSSYGRALPDGASDTVIMNYTKPENSTSSSLWQIKEGNSSYNQAYNLSIPSECWNAYDSNVIFRLNSAYSSPCFYGDWECYNGTGYLNLTEKNCDGYYYEEAVYWYLETTTTTTTIPTTTTTLYTPPQTPMSNAVRSILFAFIIMFSSGALLYTMKRKDLSTEQMIEAAIAIVIGCFVALMLFGAW